MSRCCCIQCCCGTVTLSTHVVITKMETTVFVMKSRNPIITIDIRYDAIRIVVSRQRHLRVPRITTTLADYTELLQHC